MDLMKNYFHNIVSLVQQLLTIHTECHIRWFLPVLLLSITSKWSENSAATWWTQQRWFGGVIMVRMLTCDREVMGSTPGRLAIKWLLPGWVTVYIIQPVHNQTPRSTYPSIHPGSVNRVPACLIGVKAGRVHLCWVAGNTV